MKEAISENVEGVGDGGVPASNQTRLQMADRDRELHVSGGSPRPTRVEELVWLAAEVCGITPLDVLVEQRKPGPLSRHMLSAWLRDYEGWSWRLIGHTLGRDDSTIRANYSNFKRKLRGPNGLNELYAIFQRRAAKGRMDGAALGRGGSFLQAGTDPPQETP